MPLRLPAGLTFSSSSDGTLTIVGQNAAGVYEVRQTAETQVSARTMALKPQSHEVYLAAATADSFDPPTAEQAEPRPHMKEGTFKIITVSPIQADGESGRDLK